MALSPLVALYSYALQPIAPFTYFGLGISSLDVVAAVRLCVVLRQIREVLWKEHVTKKSTGDEKGMREVEEKSLVRDLATTLVVVYGGETMTGPMLGIPPSFMLSGVTPALYMSIQALVEYLPTMPTPSIHTELPLAIVDGFTRAMLLCSLIPPTVTTNSSPVIAESPWTLLLTSLITANGGFFLTNLFSFLHPTPFTLTTPAELLPYGWTTTDLWCAPLVTGLYATLTHAQPFWTEAHTFIVHLLGVGGTSVDGEVKALDADTARAACAVLLASMFCVRTVKNFGYQWSPVLKAERGELQACTIGASRRSLIKFWIVKTKMQ